MSKIVLMGYYGHKNFGDDLLLNVIVEHLGKINFIDLITSDKRAIQISDVKHLRIHETYKSNKYKNLKLFFNVLRDKDYLLWGGGTCFSDEDGVINPLILLLAKALSVKIVFIGVGGNKITKPKNMMKMKLNSFLIDKIYVRDQMSIDNLSQYFKNNKIALTEDMAYLYHNKNPLLVNKKKITISLRNLDNYIGQAQQESLLRNLMNFIVNITNSDKFTEINILALENDLDYKINKQFYNLLNERNLINVKVNILYECDFNAKISYIQDSGLFIGVRLHGIMVAELSGIRTIGISYSPKVESYMKEVGSKGLIPIDEALSDSGIFYLKYQEAYKNNVHIDIIKRRQKAKINFELFESNLG